MKTSKYSNRIAFAIATVAASISMGAHAEFRCQAPTTQEDERACELAQMARPDELRLFIQRTSAIYGLSFYDYVKEADVNRWQEARRSEEARSILAGDDSVQKKSESR